MVLFCDSRHSLVFSLIGYVRRELTLCLDATPSGTTLTCIIEDMY
jgi:hypothetical protein